MDARLPQLAYVYILGVTFLCSMTDVRAGPVQIVELLQILGLGAFILSIFLFRTTIRLDRETVYYAALLILWLIGIIISVLVTFDPAIVYLPADAVGMRSPEVVSIARIFQMVVIFSNVVFFCWCFLISRAYLRAAVFGFLLGGLVSAVFALVCYAIIKIGGPELRGAYANGGWVRARGLFNEGGPFGLYLVAQIAVALLAHKMGWIKPRTLFLFLGIFGFGLIASVSFAGYVTLLTLMAAGVVFGPWGLFRKTVAVGVLSVGAAVIVVGFAIPKLEGYIASYAARLAKPVDARFDPNVDMGRIAAAFIVPSIVMEKPIFGVGFGQYPVARNAVEYRGPVPFSTSWDLHGTGLFGLTAEIGIPLTLLLCFILLRPTLSALMRGRDWWLALVGLYPCIALSIGTLQVNFFYPWLVLAMIITVTSGRYGVLGPERGTPVRAVECAQRA